MSFIKIGRDDPCPCGSGKRYGPCCASRAPVQPARAPAAEASLRTALHAALEHHQAGRLTQAEALYRQILQGAPNHPDALHLLGVIARQTGNHELAVELIRKALSVHPSAPMYCNLGATLNDQGQLDAAIECYRQALAIKPDSAEAHYNLGLALQQQGKLDAAIECYRQALAIKPDYAGAHNNLGLALNDQGQLDAAAASYRQALAITPNNAEALNNLGLILIDQRKLDAAVASYRNALAIRPDFADAHYNLGNALRQQGQPDAAVECYRKALAIKPDFVEAHSNLGNALKDQGKLDAAIESYRQALAIKPDFAEGHSNLGIALKAQGQLDAAVESYRQALAIKPDSAEAHYNLGLALQQQGRLDAAVESYRQALAIKPDFAEAYGNLGNAFNDQRKLDAAIECYRQALAIKPDHPETHYNLGLALQQQCKFEAAIGSYRQALAIKPDYAEAHNDLGNTLKDQGQLDAALESYHHALAIKPNFAEAYNNLGTALQQQINLDAAIGSYRKAIAIKPDYAEAYSNLGNALKEQCKLDAALESYRQALAIKPDYAGAYSNYLLTAQYSPDYSPAKLLAEHVAFGERFEAPLRATWRPHTNDCDPQRKLNIGFVSGDLRTHPVGFFLEGVLAHLERQALEVSLYSTHSQLDALTRRLQAMGFAWKSLVGVPDEQAAQRIREDAIDILIDLSGHTGHNRLRLFARKPAPVQVSWLGYPATTGLQAIDYLLCDRYGVPPAETDQFVEQPWYLPDTYLCLTPLQEQIEVGALPALSQGHVTFGSFNNLTKMNEAVVALWAQLLHALPDSRLLLKTKQLNDAAMRQATLSRFAARGITAERIVLTGTTSRAEHLASYHGVDIALDPFPYNGTTTSVEGLWMGVPLITRCGDRFVAHQGESILRNVGLPDWIAADDEAYVAIAMARAADLTGLADLRQGLRTRLLASPLCDVPRFARNFEAALRAMWQAYCSQEPRAPVLS